MSRVEKAAEPSMEEILASIRKIISEEPASPRSAMPAAPPVSTPSPRQEASGLRPDASAAGAANGGLASLAAAGNPRKASLSVPAVDDVLDALSNDIPTRPNTAAKPLATPASAPIVAAPPQPSAAPATPTTPAVPLEAPPWLMQKPQGSATTGDKRPAMPAAPAPQLPVRDAPRPFFADASANLPSPAATALSVNGAGTVGETLRRPHADLGAVVPARGESAQGPSLSLPAAGLARPAPGGQREELVIVPHTTVGNTPTNGHLNGASHRDPATDTRLAEPSRPAAATPAPGSPAPGGGGRSDPVPHSRVIAPMAPAATGLNGSAPAARHAEAEVKPDADAKPEAKPASAPNGTGTAPNGMAPKSAAAAAPRPATAPDTPAKPAPLATGAPVPSAPAAPLAPLAPVAPVGAQPLRTMEDTVAELLRPMLRQWLDANMPRIVEKALRVELAESAKKKH